MNPETKILRLWVKSLAQKPGTPEHRAIVRKVEELKARYPVQKPETKELSK